MRKSVIQNLARTVLANKKVLSDAEKKLLINLEYERAGESPPYDWAEIHSQAQNARNVINGAVENVPDEVAEFTKWAFERLEGNGRMIPAGTRINYKGTIKRAAVDLWDTAENTPDNAPALWEDINKKGEYREIPETITAGLAFSKDECGWWKGTLYKSLIDDNVWNPEQYAAGWEVIE